MKELVQKIRAGGVDFMINENFEMCVTGKGLEFSFWLAVRRVEESFHCFGFFWF